MRVIFVDSIPNPGMPGKGGLSDITWRLARELAEAGVSIGIVGPYDDGVAIPEGRADIVVHAVPEAIITRQNIVALLSATFRLAKAAKRHARKDTVYHVNDSITAASLSVLGQANRVVWHGHMNVFYHSRDANPWDTSMFYLMGAATRIAARHGVVVTALGPSLQMWWERSGFPASNIFTIPNGIDLIPDEIGNGGWSVPRQWKQFQYHIAYVGRLSAEKGGYRELIEAVSMLNREGQSVFLLLVGDGPERETIVDLVETLDCASCVSLAGQLPRSTAQYIMRLVDLVVLPSKGEMMPRVMLEAWAAGTPFLATPVGSIPDYLNDNHNGYLVKELSVQGLAERIRDTLIDHEKRAQVAEQGRKTAASLNWANAADLFLKVYEQVLARQSTEGTNT